MRGIGPARPWFSLRGPCRLTSIVGKIPGLKKWAQRHVISAPGEAAPDGIGESWFDDPDAISSPEMVAAVEDAKNFLDMERTYAVAADEKTMKRNSPQ